jgi:ER degradation enhancer, mannosidase alpha-like 1
LSGIGGFVDSFYEYLYKAYILFGDQEYKDMFDISYEEINKKLRCDKTHLIYDFHWKGKK